MRDNILSQVYNSFFNIFLYLYVEMYPIGQNTVDKVSKSIDQLPQHQDGKLYKYIANYYMCRD